MKLTTAISAALLAAVAFGATAVLAQQNPILERQEFMKADGKEAKLGAAMAKGEKPLDLAARQEDIRHLRERRREDAQPLPARFEDRP